MLYLLTLLSLPSTKAFAGTSERSLIIVPVALFHRAKEIGPAPRRSCELPARTILVVFAAKLIKKLVLHLLALLGFYLVLKILLVPVPAGQVALLDASFGVA